MPVDETARWDPEQAKLYLLIGSVVVGGIAFGWGVSQGWAEEKLPDMPPRMSQQLGTWAAFNIGLVLLGASVRDAVAEYGFAKVAGFSLGVPAVALAIRALRS
jgi:hypothetical protein